MSANRRRLRIYGIAFSGAIIVALLLVMRLWKKVENSLPVLDGELPLAGLSAPATLTRDAIGAVTISGANQRDIYRAEGFAHAQDRFFQMDLLRRRAAGELAELLGKQALTADQDVRIHRLKQLAGKVVAALNSKQRADFEAYVAGVNAGLGALDVKPWEYLALGVEPRPWTLEDCALVAYAMALDLQDHRGNYDLSLNALSEVRGDRATNLFAPYPGPHDNTFDGSTGQLGPLSTERGIDLRQSPADQTAATAEPKNLADTWATGSNALLVSGRYTPENQGALLANDMHLSLRVPGIWYHATLRWSGADGTAHWVAGASLPGLPGVIAGMNEHIAWGFTNAYVDSTDIILVNRDLVAPEVFYSVGTDLREYQTVKETIHVRGGDDVSATYQWTDWGPMIGTTPRGYYVALKWLFHDPAALNFDLLDLATATTVDDATAIAHRAGIPPQNFMVADDAGNIAWTLAGKLPRRWGTSGRVPSTWSYGDRGWRGYLSPADTPLIRLAADGAVTTAGGVDLPPESPIRRGILWTGNQRLLGGAAGEALGDGGYCAPYRAAQLQEGLLRLVTPAQAKVTPADLLGILLDDRARLLTWWQQRLLDQLSDDAIRDHPLRAKARELVANWSGHAAMGDAGYLIVRTWRSKLAHEFLDPILAPVRGQYPEFNPTWLNWEPGVRRLLAEQPGNFLPLPFANYPELETAALDATLAELAKKYGSLAKATWGEANRAHLAHPISGGLPDFAAAWLDMPYEPLPGDTLMPRVQSPSFGASQRFATIAGQSEGAIYHQATGNSGHFMSPYYRAGFSDWAAGNATPLLPGEPEHTLTLTP